jgi:hypothetical protein
MVPAMLCKLPAVAATALFLVLGGCSLGVRADAAKSIAHFLDAARRGDRPTFEAALDRPALRADLHDQITDIGRGKQLEIDGGPSEFTLDRRVTPRSVQLAAARAGLDPAVAPTPAGVAARLRVRGRAHACLGPPGQDRCVLTFSKRAGAWRLAGMQAADLRENP